MKEWSPEDASPEFEYAWRQFGDLGAMMSMVIACEEFKSALTHSANDGILKVLKLSWEEIVRCGGYKSLKLCDRYMSRWQRAQQLREIPKDEFQVEFGCRRTLENIHKIISQQLRAEGERASAETIRKDCMAYERIRRTRDRFLSAKSRARKHP